MRATPYSSKPTENWHVQREKLSSTTLLLVARSGPTVFNVHDENKISYRVVIGNPHTCTCHSGKDICVHQLFCLLKVLRIPESHPLAWQSSLTDSETDQVLSGHCQEKKRSRIKTQREKEEPTAETASKVQRQILGDDDDICPICQDDMTKEQALSWCRNGCGNNVHAKCMQSYAQYKISNRDIVGCPLCREPWATDLLKDDCKGKASLKHSCAPVKCFVCAIPQRNEFHRCIECSQAAYVLKKKAVDICPRCFNVAGIPREHTHHHFLISDASVMVLDDISWTPVINPRAPPKVLDAEVLERLQQRDLATEDYDFLLALDRIGPPDLTSHLVEALQVEDKKKSIAGLGLTTPSGATAAQSAAGRCWCAAEKLDKQLKLSCGHFGHESCLKNKILQCTSEGVWQLSNLLCGFIDCGKKIFGGLSRLRKTSDAASDGTEKEAGPGTIQQSTPSGRVQGLALLSGGRTGNGDAASETVRWSSPFTITGVGVGGGVNSGIMGTDAQSVGGVAVAGRISRLTAGAMSGGLRRAGRAPLGPSQDADAAANAGPGGPIATAGGSVGTVGPGPSGGGIRMRSQLSLHNNLSRGDDAPLQNSVSVGAPRATVQAKNGAGVGANPGMGSFGRQSRFASAVGQPSTAPASLASSSSVNMGDLGGGAIAGAPIGLGLGLGLGPGVGFGLSVGSGPTAGGRSGRPLVSEDTDGFAFANRSRLLGRAAVGNLGLGSFHDADSVSEMGRAINGLPNQGTAKKGKLLKPPRPGRLARCGDQLADEEALQQRLLAPQVAAVGSTTTSASMTRSHSLVAPEPPQRVVEPSTAAGPGPHSRSTERRAEIPRHRHLRSEDADSQTVPSAQAAPTDNAGSSVAVGRGGGLGLAIQATSLSSSLLPSSGDEFSGLGHGQAALRVGEKQQLQRRAPRRAPLGSLKAAKKTNDGVDLTIAAAAIGDT